MKKMILASVAVLATTSSVSALNIDLGDVKVTDKEITAGNVIVTQNEVSVGKDVNVKFDTNGLNTTTGNTAVSVTGTGLTAHAGDTKVVIGNNGIDVYTWASNVKITTAKNEVEFAPNRTITRDEVAVLVERLKNTGVVSGGAPTGTVVKFIDDKNISAEFKNAVELVQKYSIMKGNNGYFYPKNNLTVYEALVILSRATLSGEVKNFNDAMQFANKIGIQIAEKDMDTKILRKKFFEIIYAASENAKK